LSATHSGTIVAAYGRRFLVRADDERHYDCVVRGKRTDLACGDRVQFAATDRQSGVVESIEPRTTVLARESLHRRKLIAANLRQVAVLVAAEPSFTDELVARVLVAAEQQSLASLIVLNKIDLVEAADAARARLAPFAGAGHRIVEISAKRDVSPLVAHLTGRLTALVGQSGMGKSTIVNALVPYANAATQEISRFLDSGRHTTTFSRVYTLDGGGAIIDCPGLQEFGLAHLARAEVEAGFPELRERLGHCRFTNCRHDSEPDCAVKAALADGALHPRRYALLLRLTAEPRRG
jgi:ribosome biogenesis GTPase